MISVNKDNLKSLSLKNFLDVKPTIALIEAKTNSINAA